jgi:hypothetical protein
MRIGISTTNSAGASADKSIYLLLAEIQGGNHARRAGENPKALVQIRGSAFGNSAPMGQIFQGAARG